MNAEKFKILEDVFSKDPVTKQMWVEAVQELENENQSHKLTS